MASFTVSALNGAEREFLHDCTLKVLERTGVRFDSAAARSALAEASCRIDEDTSVVRFPRDLVEWALAKLRSDVLLAARDPVKDAVLDGSHTVVVPAGICPYVRDEASGERRDASLEDLAAFGRVCDELDEIGALWFPVVPDTATCGTAVDLVSLATLLATTSKHIQGQLVRPADVPVAQELLAAACPDEDLRKRPIFSSLYCPVSPMVHEAEPIEAALAMVAAGIPLLVITLPLAGGTAPVTLAGAMVQNMAETLSAVVLFKLANEDCPLILAGTTALMDLASGAFATSVPEIALLNAAHVEWLYSYGAPAMSVGYPTDSFGFSHRAGVESMGYGTLTRLARPDMMLGPGNMAAGTVMSLTKLVFDCDLLSYSARLLAGIQIDEEHALLDAIDQVGPGGNHLEREETLAFLRRREHWRPRLLARTTYEDWLRGPPDEMRHAADRVKELLGRRASQPLPEGALGRMKQVLLDARPEARAVVERL